MRRLRKTPMTLAQAVVLLAFFGCRGDAPESTQTGEAVRSIVGTEAAGMEADAQGATLPDDAIATFTGGYLLAEELDQAVLAMPPSQRQTLTLENADGYRTLVQELVLDRLLLEEAKLLGVDQSPEFQLQARGARRRAVVDAYLPAHLKPSKAPTEADIEAEFERQKHDFQRAERRLLFNIFRQRSEDSTQEALVAELRDLRQRVLDGQSFASLASQASDSESRHNHGQLGWFERGQLSPDLEKVVFGLEEGVPSEPISTHDGAHLFYVDVVVEAKSFQLDEVRSQLAARLQQQRREQALRELEGQLDADIVVDSPAPQALSALLQSDDPQTMILRVGDQEIRLAQFRQLLQFDRNQRPGSIDDRAQQVLDTLRRAEHIFQQHEAKGASLDPPAEAKLAKTLDHMLAFFYRQQKMALALDRDPQKLRDFYEDNRRRFSSPLKLDLRSLSIPLDEHASQNMAILERRRNDLEAGTTDLTTLADTLGGKIHTWGWRTPEEMQTFHPRLTALVASVAGGHFTPPLTTASHMHIVQILQRQEPEPLPYEQVRGAVRTAYLETHGQRLYSELRRELLQAADFHILEARLSSMLRSGLGILESSNVDILE